MRSGFNSANNLGPDGGTKLAAGLAGNCGVLTELVVTDNRLGAAAATAVAATMRGGTLQCLEGFGSRAGESSKAAAHARESASGVHGTRGGVPGTRGGGIAVAVGGSTDLLDAAEGRERAREPPSALRRARAGIGERQDQGRPPAWQRQRSG